MERQLTSRILLILFWASPLALAGTINVPADQPTIQAGITAAVNGDTVLVAPGTYKENIDFQGKAITVTSSAGAAATTIDGSQGSFAVIFQNGEGRSSVINGFTIQNAGASLWPDSSATEFAGVKVTASNPTITNNIVTENYGYGVFLVNGGAFISGNTISYASTAYNPQEDYGCDYDDGDGIFLIGAPNDPSATTTISNNTVEYNVGHCEGGGIGIYATSALITDNTIRYNQSLGFGGGIWDSSGSPIIQNLIYGNSAGAAGGGIYLGNAADLYIINNTIVGNALFENGGIGGYVDGSQIAFGGSVSGTAFFNNIIVAGDSYGAIACNPVYQYLSPTPMQVDNSDLLNFSGATFSGWCVVPPTVTSDVISGEPVFVASGSEPFRLQPNSLAIGTGDTSAPSLPAEDFDGNPRIQNGSVDMGVYEGGYTQASNPPADFSLTASPASFTIANGQSVNSTITVIPTGGYIGDVSFSCTQLPTNMSCSFSPVGVAAGGDNTALSTSVTISYSSGNARPSNRQTRHRLYASLLPLTGGVLSCFSFGCGKRSRSASKLRAVAVICFGLLISVTIISCGGNHSSQPPPPPNVYTIVVTAAATGNTVSASHTLPLTVTLSS
jgi:parallel beta-helix repeat protein